MAVEFVCDELSIVSLEIIKYCVPRNNIVSLEIMRMRPRKRVIKLQ